MGTIIWLGFGCPEDPEDPVEWVGPVVHKDDPPPPEEDTPDPPPEPTPPMTWEELVAYLRYRRYDLNEEELQELIEENWRINFGEESETDTT